MWYSPSPKERRLSWALDQILVSYTGFCPLWSLLEQWHGSGRALLFLLPLLLSSWMVLRICSRGQARVWRRPQYPPSGVMESSTEGLSLLHQKCSDPGSHGKLPTYKFHWWFCILKGKPSGASQLRGSLLPFSPTSPLLLVHLMTCRGCYGASPPPSSIRRFLGTRQQDGAPKERKESGCSFLQWGNKFQAPNLYFSNSIVLWHRTLLGMYFSS